MAEHFKKIFFAMILVLVLAVAGSALALEEDGEYVIWSQGMQYTVQKGDTLWDLSERHFDSPAMWPELWRLNPQIANPHWLTPGEVINLYEVEGSHFVPKPEPPPLPPPEPEPVEEIVEEPEKPPAYHYPRICKAGFVKKVPVQALGRIVKIRENKFLAGQGDTIYLELAGQADEYVEGDRFTLYKLVGKVKDNFANHRFKKFKKSVVGTQHLILGEIVCIGIRQGLMVAKVEVSYRSIKIDDLFMPYRNLSPDVVFCQGLESLEGRILAAENKSKIVGESDVIFIDKGTDHGVVSGQIYTIYVNENDTGKWKNKQDILFPTDLGELIVLFAQTNNSTALITMSKRAISPGAMIHAQTNLVR